MNQKPHEPGAGDADWDPAYNRWTQCVHPCCNRCSDEEGDDPDREAAGADSDEWVKQAEQATATKAREQATVEHHEQQAQKEPQEDQHHGGESPQREAQTAPQKAEHDHE
jgi:hypothetical protein